MAAQEKQISGERREGRGKGKPNLCLGSDSLDMGGFSTLTQQLVW